MHVPKDLEPVLVNVGITSVMTGINLAMVVYQILNHQYGKGKHMMNLQLAQLTLSLAKNIHMVFLSGFTMFDCQSLVMSEWVFYILWVPAMEAVLLLRARTFSVYPRITTAFVAVVWAIRLAIGIYSTSTVVAVSPPGAICVFISDWSTADYTLICTFLSQAAMFIAFAHRMVILVRGTSGVLEQKHSAKYTKLLRNGFSAALALLASFAIQSQLIKLPVFAPYMLSFFIVENMVAAGIVSFVLDDTRSMVRKQGGSKAQHKDSAGRENSESGSGHNSGAHPPGMHGGVLGTRSTSTCHPHSHAQNTHGSTTATIASTTALSPHKEL